MVLSPVQNVIRGGFGGEVHSILRRNKHCQPLMGVYRGIIAGDDEE